MTREDIKDICYGRDDLLAIAEQICSESGLSSADGEVLCEELARTAFEYLNWVNETVEESLTENYRTFADTQIFKEYRCGECEITEEEWTFIRDAIERDNNYKVYDDKANGYIAISFDGIDQSVYPEWGEELVSSLNAICENWGEDADWYLGDVKEEYVFVD